MSEIRPETPAEFVVATAAFPRGHRCQHVAYRIDCGEYERLRLRAQGRCEVCRTDQRPLGIDHDHAIGYWAPRGLLCQRCNQLLGRIESNMKPMTDVVRTYLLKPFHAELGRPLRGARSTPTPL